MSLYRKYRPLNFSEVIGQEHITGPLSSSLILNRINHAYLFSGPRGCGKTSSARILARSLNCELGPTPIPCEICDSCISLSQKGSGNLDVVELDAASHGGVEDARELRERAFFAPSQFRYRVFIIDEAHMITKAGFNSLLKIIEEPPRHLIFIFATTEPEKILPTIKSRTHRYPFKLLNFTAAQSLIEKICTEEKFSVESSAFPLIIRAGEGSPRDTLSTLDQLLISSSGLLHQTKVITYSKTLTTLGIVDLALIDEIILALSKYDSNRLFCILDKAFNDGINPYNFANNLLERFRDLIVIQISPDSVSCNTVIATDNVLERMKKQTVQFSIATLTRYAEVLYAGIKEIRKATVPRLIFEIICFRLLLPLVSNSESALLQRIERIESHLKINSNINRNKSYIKNRELISQLKTDTDSHRKTILNSNQNSIYGVVKKSNSTKKFSPIRNQDSLEELKPNFETVSNIDEVKLAWAKVRRKIREISRTTEIILSGAIVQIKEEKKITIHHESLPLAKRLTEPRNSDVIKEALKSVFGIDWQIHYKLDDLESIPQVQNINNIDKSLRISSDEKSFFNNKNINHDPNMSSEEGAKIKNSNKISNKQSKDEVINNKEEDILKLLYDELEATKVENKYYSE